MKRLLARQLQSSIPPERLVRVGDEEAIVGRIGELIVEGQRPARVVRRAAAPSGPGSATGTERTRR